MRKPSPPPAPVVAEPQPLFSVSASCLRYCARLIHDDATVTGEAGREVCAEMIGLAKHMKDLADELPLRVPDSEVS